MKIDIWLKRVWFVNGIIILSLLLIVCFEYLIKNLSFSKHQSSGIVVSPTAKNDKPDNIIHQDLTLALPEQIADLDLMYIGVGIKDLSNPISSSSESLIKYSSFAGKSNLVNIIFSKRDGTKPYLFLNQKAFIKYCYIPEPSDTMNKYNTYDIAFFDTNNDGRINGSDSTQLYISNLDGQHLTQIIPSGMVAKKQQQSPDHKQLYFILKEKSQFGEIALEDLPDRLYVFDTKLRVLSPFFSSDSVFQKIRKLIWEN